MNTNDFYEEDSGNLEECVLSLHRIEKLLKTLIKWQQNPYMVPEEKKEE